MINFNDSKNVHTALPTGLSNRSGAGNSQFTWLQFILGVNQQDSNGNSIVQPPGPFTWVDNTWEFGINGNVTAGSGTVDADYIANTWYAKTTSTGIAPFFPPPTVDNDTPAGSLFYTGGPLNCNLELTIIDTNSGGPFNNAPILIHQNGVPILDINAADNALYPIGVHNIPFVIGAGVGTEIRIFNAACQSYGNGGVARVLEYSVVLTP